MSELENIERCCQLHEAVEITYVVDGYVAALMTRVKGPRYWRSRNRETHRRMSR